MVLLMEIGQAVVRHVNGDDIDLALSRRRPVIRVPSPPHPARQDQP